MIRVRAADDGCSGDPIHRPRPIEPQDRRLRAVRVRIEAARSELIGARARCREGEARPMILELAYDAIDESIRDLEGLERELTQSIDHLERVRRQEGSGPP